MGSGTPSLTLYFSLFIIYNIQSKSQYLKNLFGFSNSRLIPDERFAFLFFPSFGKVFSGAFQHIVYQRSHLALCTFLPFYQRVVEESLNYQLFIIGKSCFQGQFMILYMRHYQLSYILRQLSGSHRTDGVPFKDCGCFSYWLWGQLGAWKSWVWYVDGGLHSV